MSDLVLHLKKEYFDQVVSGEKVEEYRLTTAYWCQRLEGRTYDNVILLCGYPSADDESRRIVRPWHGCVRKAITHKHFGNSSVEVFAISLAPNNACTRQRVGSAKEDGSTLEPDTVKSVGQRSTPCG